MTSERLLELYRVTASDWQTIARCYYGTDRVADADDVYKNRFETRREEFLKVRRWYNWAQSLPLQDFVALASKVPHVVVGSPSDNDYEQYLEYVHRTRNEVFYAVLRATVSEAPTPTPTQSTVEAQQATTTTVVIPKYRRGRVVRRKPRL